MVFTHSVGMSFILSAMSQNALCNVNKNECTSLFTVILFVITLEAEFSTLNYASKYNLLSRLQSHCFLLGFNFV